MNCFEPRIWLSHACVWYVSLCSRVTVPAGPKKTLVNERSRRSYRPPLPPEGASLDIRPAAPPMPTMPPAAGHLLDSTPSGSSIQTEPLSAADRRGSHAEDEVWKMPSGLRDAAQRTGAL